MANQVGPQAVINGIKERAPFWAEKLPELPELLYDSLKQGKAMNQRMDMLYQGYRETKRQQGTGKFLFGVGATLIVCSAILLGGPYQQLSALSGAVGITFWLLSWRTYRR